MQKAILLMYIPLHRLPSKISPKTLHQ